MNCHCFTNQETGYLEECDECRDIREPLPPHVKRCRWCQKTVNELKESCVQEGYPVRVWWHVHCWNEVHAASPEEEDNPDHYEGPQTLADVGMCEDDFR